MITSIKDFATKMSITISQPQRPKDNNICLIAKVPILSNKNLFHKVFSSSSQICWNYYQLYKYTNKSGAWEVCGL